MKRPTSLLAMIAAVVFTGPAAVAGTDIVKCVAADGHVTLTDQPCPAGDAAVTLSRDTQASAGAQTQEQQTAQQTGQPGAPPDTARAQPPAQRYVLPAAELRHAAWQRPAAAQPAPLAGDIATLKAARRTLMLQESTRTSLAGLN
ncbi:DUF4124 domain-containing protein [Massilia forsythiae]|uniref:DUF4124 domain-containing protein n=1 Tax=Massilia forsythiae TaxID=2728020 RepID=A0A7Z2ZTB4_9BURK|nr:DUF4124 domain-containing protein [Massilia forsythiae]QJE01408.1 DUF4124 domain-containing protein [Massilia forsythiae]